MNDMVVTYKVSYSNSDYSKEFSWAWNAPDNVSKMFPFCLKKLFHFKNRKVFLMYPVFGLNSFCHSHLSWNLNVNGL